MPLLVGRACALVGLLDIAAGVFPRFRHSRMHALAEVLPGSFGPFAAALSLSAGVLLLLLPHGLKRRKRRAWRAAVALLPFGAVAQFTYRHSVAGVLISLALLLPLLRHRDQFAALPDPRSRWRALANVVLMGAGSLALGLVVVNAHPRHMVGEPSLADRLTHVLYGLFGVEGPVDYRGTTSWTVAFSLGALGLLTAVTTAYLALRPEHPAARLTEDDEARLRALLAKQGGRDSLGHFALRRDKAVVFSPSGKAAVTYRVVSGVMLASGDPIGDVEAWPGAIERFMDEARAHSWTPAVMGCSETGGEVWTRETGLDALELGDEAVVDAADFSLAGRSMRNVRKMVKRIERAGYETRVRRVADPVLRAWRELLVFLSRWFQIESLYKFNAKFRPRWEPRFVVYRASAGLPRIGVAGMQAEGFVTLALPLPRFLRHRAPVRRPCAHRVTEPGVRAA
ncbi:hypothetical protein GCM10022384_21160 [Streptomyces marokkonensis]|uniref:DUF2156 domain-containing protein n=1 Tax=Streptomyces marokkonensis TaxID=324855 RepID=A0ABP7PQU0_9ACTN